LTQLGRFVNAFLRRRLAMGCRNKQRLAAAAVCVLVVTLAGTPASAQRPVEADRGIAARYVADRGIEKDPDVIFADDFESWTDSSSTSDESTLRPTNPAGKSFRG
jgi:hypothetical protein